MSRSVLAEADGVVAGALPLDKLRPILLRHDATRSEVSRLMLAPSGKPLPYAGRLGHHGKHSARQALLWRERDRYEAPWGFTDSRALHLEAYRD
ncbi:MAG: hypothetical protein WAN46_21250 [Gammaproteobacteria bacterium]